MYRMMTVDERYATIKDCGYTIDVRDARPRLVNGCGSPCMRMFLTPSTLRRMNCGASMMSSRLTRGTILPSS